MRIALSSDEPYAVHDIVVTELERRGHAVVRFGSFVAHEECPWAAATERAAVAVAHGECDEAIVFCWSGTGASIAANKVAGVRAALCADSSTAKAARMWNHANVLVLSNRSLSPDIAKEILGAWFDTPFGEEGSPGVAFLAEVDTRHRRGA